MYENKYRTAFLLPNTICYKYGVFNCTHILTLIPTGVTIYESHCLTAKFLKKSLNVMNLKKANPETFCLVFFLPWLGSHDVDKSET
jgi:hypothetical protein